MGKNYRGNKEYSREQKLIFENKQLKREVSSLRKQLARLDLDRHSYVKDIVEEHYAKENAEESAQDMLKAMKQRWLCHDCGTGYLEINIYNRLDGTFYYRACSNCSKRTKSQRYDADTVEGIMKDSTKSDKNK